MGMLDVKIDEDGGWVILAGYPAIKIDNKHDDRLPHMHVGGFNSDDRRSLRHDLTPGEAADAIRAHLERNGFIDTKELEEELS